MMTVPLLDLKLQYQTIQNDVEEALLRVARSQALILGSETQKLERSLAEYLGCSHAIAVSSGTDALLMSLMALDIKQGDEVIVPTYSFFATAGVVSRLNATPVFVDIDLVSFNVSVESIRKAITKKTKAIIAVHLYGQSADMSELMDLSKELNIPIIEDAAQSIGVQYKDGTRVGSIGRMGCFSFYPTKNLGAFGDAGLITCNDAELAVKLMQMRNHGMEPQYCHKFIGGNFRMDALQAATLNVKLPYLEQWHQKRRENAEHYCNLFCNYGLSTHVGDTLFSESNKVLLPLAKFKNSGVKNYHIYNQFVIRVQRRDQMRTWLKEHNIGTEIYYPISFHRQECFAYLENFNNYPVADICAETTLAIPIFPELTYEQLEYVVKIISEFVSNE